MDSKLYEIEIKDGNRVIKDVLDEHELGLSSAIVEKICYYELCAMAKKYLDIIERKDLEM